MNPQNNPQQALAQAIREIGAAIRIQAHDRWKGVRTAERNQGRRHVWRFRSGADATERFLHVPHKSLAETPPAKLLDQLSQARWLDRFEDGSTTSFVLAPGGRLQPWPKQ